MLQTPAAEASSHPGARSIRLATCPVGPRRADTHDEHERLDEQYQAIQAEALGALGEQVGDPRVRDAESLRGLPQRQRIVTAMCWTLCLMQITYLRPVCPYSCSSYRAW